MSVAHIPGSLGTGGLLHQSLVLAGGDGREIVQQDNTIWPRAAAVDCRRE